MYDLSDGTLLSMFLAVAALMFIAWVRTRVENWKIQKRWEQEEREKPEEFLADDEWVFVPYKDTMLPMRAMEKRFRWDKMNGAQKREAYLAVQRELKKGRMETVVGDDGNTYYLPIGGKLKGMVSRYSKNQKDFKKDLA